MIVLGKYNKDWDLLDKLIKSREVWIADRDEEMTTLVLKAISEGERDFVR